MLGDCVQGWPVTFDRVAFFATIAERRGGKLAFVGVGMAIGAMSECNFVARRVPGGDVALGTGHGGVASGERISSCGVFFDGEERRMPALDRVAGGTFTFVRTRAKLATMRIWSMAVGTFGERHRLFEIRSGVALQAIHLRMFAEERKFCFGMIEMLVARDSFPAAGDVAGRASFRKSSVVGIAVAIGTFCEFQAAELWSFLRSHVVAFRAGHRGVQAGERKSGFGMVELRGGFPIREVVALRAIRAQLTLVNILMAGYAVL